MKVFNEVTNLIKNLPYAGYEVTLDPKAITPLKVTGQCIIGKRMIDGITEICNKYDLWYYYTLRENAPVVCIYKEV